MTATTYRAAPIARAPAYRQVADAIEADILAGRLQPGDALPTEGDMAEQFGVTRSTVREGVRMLEQTGMIERGGSKRLVVARPKAADMAQAASRGLAVAGVTFGEVWEVLVVNFPQAAKLAAGRMDAEAIAALGAVTTELERVKDKQHDKIVALAMAYLDGLARGVENRFMYMVLASLNNLIGASLAQVIAGAPDARARIIAAQKEITAALAAGDAKSAKTWMRKHIDDLKRGYDIAGVALDAVLSV